MSTRHRRSTTMIPQAQHRHRTDLKRSDGGIAPDWAVPRTIYSGRCISGLAVDGKVRGLYRRPDPAALIGTLDRVMRGPGAEGLAREHSPGRARPGPPRPGGARLARRGAR